MFPGLEGRSDNEEVEKGVGLTLGVGIGELKVGSLGEGTG